MFILDDWDDEFADEWDGLGADPSDREEFVADLVEAGSEAEYGDELRDVADDLSGLLEGWSVC